MNKSRREKRLRSHMRIRKKVNGTSERPRLSVFRSLKQIYVQAIDDESGKTIASASSLEKSFRESGAKNANIDVAKQVGSNIAKRLLEAGVDKAVFDRGGLVYHGRIKAVADGAREAGLNI